MLLKVTLPPLMAILLLGWKVFYAEIYYSWQNLLEREEALQFQVEETLVDLADAVQLHGSLAHVQEGLTYAQVPILKVPNLHIQGAAALV